MFRNKMGKEEFLGMIAVVFFMAILFTQQGSDTWKLLAFIGLIFGIFWWKSK
jgi:hypothetical protein